MYTREINLQLEFGKSIKFNELEDRLYQIEIDIQIIKRKRKK